MGAIEQCRTVGLGGHVEECDACGHQLMAYKRYVVNLCSQVADKLLSHL
jgi:RecJ-like exonuclease